MLVKPDEHGDDDYENDDYEMSSEDDSEENAKYINASLISVRPSVVQPCALVFNLRGPAVAAGISLRKMQLCYKIYNIKVELKPSHAIWLDCVEQWMDASLVPTQGYWGPHAFMLAQTPLPDTVADFCSMILQYRVPAVVMLSECSQTDEVLSKHWPELEKIKPSAFGGGGQNQTLVLTEKFKEDVCPLGFNHRCFQSFLLPLPP